jgi:hypothetical protein
VALFVGRFNRDGVARTAVEASRLGGGLGAWAARRTLTLRAEKRKQYRLL